jgi:protein-S-isoprenylcysteine O-methyltransferase Ste14
MLSFSADARAAVALVLYAVFLAVVFALRTVVHRRATGGSGFHGISGSPASWAWWGGVLFVVAMVGGVVAPVLALVDLAPAIDSPPALGLLGVAIVVVATIATVAAQHAMGRSWRIGVRAGERTELVHRGPFALVRNPIFSAMMLAAFGFALVVPNAPAIASTLALVVAIEIQVRRIEEPHLLRVHGDAYARYLARVGRFVPGIGGRRGITARAR